MARSGGPQVSHFGPLLFILFINNDGNSLNSVQFLFYANDLKFYHYVHSNCETELQRNCSTDVHEWCQKTHRVHSGTQYPKV